MSPVNEHPGVMLYSRIRKSPYFYASRKHGVQLYSIYNHMYHPRHYGDPVEEYWHLLNGVTLWDVGVERQIEISGPDAFDFTQLLVARDLNKCAVEQCKYVFLCLPDGGIINDPVLLRVEENRFWLSLADSDVELWARGVAYNNNYDVTIKELDVGPAPGAGAEVEGRDGRTSSATASSRFRTTTCARTRSTGMKVLVSRTGYTSELGFEIYLYEASKHGVKMWEKVLEAGKPHGLEVIGPCHIRRIEGGILALGPGCDMWFDTNPYEVGMGYDWMVDLEQASDFIGKEALAKIKAEGPKRQLIGVEIGGSNVGLLQRRRDDRRVPRPKDGSRIGQVTSACWSPKLEKNIGFAMVPTEHSELGTEFEVERPGETVSAVVVPKPFVDPEKETPKQELTAAES